MTYPELCNAASLYRNALLVERLISGARLYRSEKILRVVVFLVLIIVAGLYLLTRVAFISGFLPAASAAALPWFSPATGLLQIALAVWLCAFLLRAFYYSTYFQDIEAILPEPLSPRRPAIRFEVACAFSLCRTDALGEFLTSRFGFLTMLRLGLSAEEVVLFLKASAPAKAETFSIVVPEKTVVGLADIARSLFRADESLRRFFAERAIDEPSFAGAAEWVARSESQYKHALRFFGRDALGRIPGIGKDWAYGETALLARYATEITEHSAFRALGESSFGTREAEEVERVLSRGREANVMLVGEEGVPKLSVMVRVAREIIAGTILPPLEHKRIFVFDGAPFVSALHEKAALEAELTRLLSEAMYAGNIIFVFDNFHTFFEATRSLGSDALALLDPFLDSPNIQIVAVVETSVFHQLLEPNPKVRERFERVQVAGVGAEAAIPILEDIALREEYRHKVFFTYQALRATAESAERYFFEGVMPDKAIDLLLELAPKVKAAQKRNITREDVLDLVSRKTGIALGEAKVDEREKLLALEKTLHERIVGQEEAVSAIAGALRRARSGVGNPNRPQGSFLFLGPTGVGKTETTKALAQAFFGDESAIVRFDMSEYQAPDALARLIGTFEGGKVGTLASALRERPFGVLLLDEFEKTNKDVHNLFLQILDEGFFTDAAGKRVNARNLMIIATSNAASDVIWNMKHETAAGDKEIITAEIINRGVFKPELLNRFDGVILFHPLKEEHLRKIARLMLEKFAKRLKEKGIELVITDGLVEYLVSVGQDPKFGARPMNRAIQEKVEQVIAEKMLRREIAAGSRVELTGAELK